MTWEGSRRDGTKWAPPGWAKLRQQVLRRDSHRCVKCGTSTGPLEVDHILAEAFGGTHDLTNLQTICTTCHKAKTAREGVQARTRHSRKRPSERHPGLRT